MALKVYIDEDDTVTLSCPVCNRTRIQDVSRFKNEGATVHIRARCPCGHRFPVRLERRKQFRKSTYLHGNYRCNATKASDHRLSEQGTMVVTNVSRKGLRLKFNSTPPLSAGDHLIVDFVLDDPMQSRIKREVVVRNVEWPHVGVEYLRASNLDSVIGFYLFK